MLTSNSVSARGDAETTSQSDTLTSQGRGELRRMAQETVEGLWRIAPPTCGACTGLVRWGGGLRAVGWSNG